MLQKNHFRPLGVSEPLGGGSRLPDADLGSALTGGDGLGFVSPEDFDCTGILAGIDPCASSYWWMPELHGHDGHFYPEPAVATAGTAKSDPREASRVGHPHATQRTGSRTTAAA